MKQRKWVSANQLDSWASRADAKSRLPELIRRLIHATVEAANLEHVNFPAGEEIHRPGYDGETNVRQGNAKVPEGITYWELGTDKNIKRKLDEDFQTRLKSRGPGNFGKVTYIAITPRDFQNKKQWAEEKNKLGQWREVRVYDSDDIEQWLEMAPGVSLWLSLYVSVSPIGLVDLSRHWQNLQDCLKQKLPSKALLVSRKRTTESFKEWLDSASNVLTVYGQSLQEVVDVFAAWVDSLPEAEQAAIVSRTIIVEKADAWRELIDSEQRLVLICAEQLEPNEGMIAEARRKGHHILVPISSVRALGEEKLRLERMDRLELERILHEAGLSEREAHSLAQQSGGSFTILKRRFSSFPSLTVPKWGRPEEIHGLAPLLLAGAWTDDSPADHEIVSTIASRPYSEILRIVNRWRSETDAPVRWANGVWEFVSPLDAWAFLNPALNSSHLDAFENAARNVLSADNPKYELPAEERWRASIFGKKFAHSNELRQALIRTLALLGTQDSSAQVADTISLQTRINRVVRGILPKDARWQRWASLGSLLPLIAEAAPEEFLAAIESVVSTKQEEILALFAQEKMGQAEHTNLLWALERVAWSPEFLPRVSLVLGRLAELDPGGQLSNRPQKSLRDIFFSWMPHTAAPYERRIETIELLLNQHEIVGWKLLLDLLPRGTGSILIHATPEWRFWAEGWERGVTHDEYLRTLKALIKLAVSTSTNKPDKWLDLIEYLARFPRDECEKAVHALELAAGSALAEDLRLKLWHTLREEVQKFRTLSDTKWALPTTIVACLEAIRDGFQPKDTVELAGPLFNRDWNAFRDKSLSWEQRAELLRQTRATAVRDILVGRGFAGIIQLARNVQNVQSVGFIFAEITGVEYETQVLPALLCHSEKRIREFACAYAAYRIHANGRDWAEALPFVEWSLDEAISFALRMPIDKRTWSFVEQLGEQAAKIYWDQVEDFYTDLPPEEIEIAALKLIATGRPFSAIDLLAIAVSQKSALAPATILTLLNMALAVPQEAGDRTLDRYNILILLEKLQLSLEADDTRLMRLEWLLLPMIDMHSYLPSTLHKLLARDPGFFIELLTLLYLPHHRADLEEAPQEKPEVSEFKRRQGERAWQLLHGWQRIPGSQDDGTVDAHQLRTWVMSAREKATQVDRLEVCDITLGEVFAYAPGERDGSWPCIPVCEVVEEVKSAELDKGFIIGIFNKRGIVSKSLGEGGGQERELAAKFKTYAEAYQDRYPRTAAALMHISGEYTKEAKVEDARVEAEK